LQHRVGRFPPLDTTRLDKYGVTHESALHFADLSKGRRDQTAFRSRFGKVIRANCQLATTISQDDAFRAQERRFWLPV
jgi:hypothetical protein